jgi:hypothetical protein
LLSGYRAVDAERTRCCPAMQNQRRARVVQDEKQRNDRGHYNCKFAATTLRIRPLFVQALQGAIWTDVPASSLKRE